MVSKNVAEILTHHVTFELEAIDRMYLNAYVPSLQTGGGFVGNLCEYESDITRSHLLQEADARHGRKSAQQVNSMLISRRSIARRFSLLYPGLRLIPWQDAGICRHRNAARSSTAVRPYI